MNQPPRAVVFDLFHTLVDTEHLRPPGFVEIDAVAQVCDLDVDTLRPFWAETYTERETTPVDLVDLVDRFARTIRHPLTSAERMAVDQIFGVTRDEALRSPDPAIVDLLAAVAARSAVGVLSNCHAREVREWKHSPLAEHVDVLGRSCEIGVMKPDPAAYRWILRRLRTDPADAVYIGNGGSDELQGARDVGFASVVHCNVYDRHNGLATTDEQRRRAGQAHIAVETVDELAAVLDHPDPRRSSEP